MCLARGLHAVVGAELLEGRKEMVAHRAVRQVKTAGNAGDASAIQGSRLDVALMRSEGIIVPTQGEQRLRRVNDALAGHHPRMARASSAAGMSSSRKPTAPLSMAGRR